MPDIKEPDITINGVPLSSAQAMAVRVAVSNFYGELMGPQEYPSAIDDLYRTRLREVQDIMRR